MTTINLALNVQVLGGPQFAFTETKPIEAYDKIEVVIDPGAEDKSVNLQPGDADQINFLLIKSSIYGTELSFKASNGNAAEDSKVITLDEPQIYLGTEVVKLLTVAPKILKFTNNFNDPGKKALIEILVGRDATP